MSEIIAIDEAPKPHRRSKRRTTVVTFKADLTKTTYHFNSRPDYDRIRREAEADNVVVMLVFPGYFKEDRDVVMLLPSKTGRRFARSDTPLLFSVIRTVLGNPPAASPFARVSVRGTFNPSVLLANIFSGIGTIGKHIPAELISEPEQDTPLAREVIPDTKDPADGA